MPESNPVAVHMRTAYGDGAFVRSLIICSPVPGRVSLAMEDVGHAFQIDFTHEDGKVTSVKAAWNRRPFDGCGGAATALEAMVGCPLSDNLFAIARYTDPKQQCTHMYDMFCLAATHAYERRTDYRYDVVVPDSIDGPVVATLTRNGEKQLEFEMNGEDYVTIVQPEACRGLSILRGFMPWVKANVPVNQHELYFLMQKALFVSRIQKFDLTPLLGKSAELSGPPSGSCYASQSERYQTAVRVNVSRRFSREPAGQGLEFFKPR